MERTARRKKSATEFLRLLCLLSPCWRLPEESLLAAVYHQDTIRLPKTIQTSKSLTQRRVHRSQIQPLSRHRTSLHLKETIGH